MLWRQKEGKLEVGYILGIANSLAGSWEIVKIQRGTRNEGHGREEKNQSVIPCGAMVIAQGFEEIFLEIWGPTRNMRIQRSITSPKILWAALYARL
jgi:hypothetical protein